MFQRATLPTQLCRKAGRGTTALDACRTLRLPNRRLLIVRAVQLRPKEEHGSEQKPHNGEKSLKGFPRLLVTAAAATASSAAVALAGLLPAGMASAMDSLAPYDAPFELDPAFVDVTSPELMEVMFVVVATYLGLMVLYLWLASMIDEEPGAGGTASGGDTRSSNTQSADDLQQQQLPPGYSRYLHANIRSVREPRRGHELVAPSPEENPGAYLDGLSGLKEALSSQAADFVAQQVKECGSVVRRKLYLRRLAAKEAARLPHTEATASSSSLGKAAPLALMIGQPGQLELLVDQCLDNMPADLLADSSEDCLVRSITGVVARRLAAAEAGELVRFMQAAMKHRQKDVPAFGLESW